MENPYDGLYQVGLAVTRSGKQVDWQQATQYLLGWCVKGFFIPLMATYALGEIKWFLSTTDFVAQLRQPGGYYGLAFRMLYFIDLTFGIVGYLCALRLVGTHIRTTEPTLLGWVVCILCYEPFWPVFSYNFFPYEDGFYWGDWLANSPWGWMIWSFLILFFLSIYVWATVSFGIRFSNLTNRGILTNGPYKWLKHPAYVSKNISWWLISIPFLSNQPIEIAARNCILLLGINMIYLARAKTEERHLFLDPAYVEYNNWIKTHGLGAALRRYKVRAAKKLGRSL
jgi:protein-S-isoprenylcysteine O-methyltransferase Ste14